MWLLMIFAPTTMLFGLKQILSNWEISYCIIFSVYDKLKSPPKKQFFWHQYYLFITNRTKYHQVFVIFEQKQGHTSSGVAAMIEKSTIKVRHAKII
jgi:hypothetical protein